MESNEHNSAWERDFGNDDGAATVVRVDPISAVAGAVRQAIEGQASESVFDRLVREAKQTENPLAFMEQAIKHIRRHHRHHRLL